MLSIRELPRPLLQRGERRDVVAVLLAAAPVGPAILGADECLRRTFAVGGVIHVQAVLADHLLQVVAAILPDAKAVDLLHRVERERVQFPAIRARTRQRHVLPPVLRRLRRASAALQKKLRAVFPEPCHGVIALADQIQRGHEDGHGIEHGRPGGQLFGGGSAQCGRVQFAQRIQQFRDERGVQFADVPAHPRMHPFARRKRADRVNAAHRSRSDLAQRIFPFRCAGGRGVADQLAEQIHARAVEEPHFFMNHFGQEPSGFFSAQNACASDQRGVVGAVVIARHDHGDKLLQHGGVAEIGQQVQHAVALFRPAGCLEARAFGSVDPRVHELPGQRHGIRSRGGRRGLRLARFDPLLQIRQRRLDARLQQHLRVALAPPDHQCRAMIRSLEARAFVSACFQQPLLVGLLIVERAAGQQFARQDRDLAELGRPVLHVAPLSHVMPPVAYLDDLEVIMVRLFVLVFVIAVTPQSVRTGIIIFLRAAGFLDVNDAQMHRATRALRRLHEHLCARRVGGFQSRKRQSVRAVLVFEQPRDLRRSALRGERLPEQCRSPGGLLRVVRRIERRGFSLAAAILHEIKNEADAIAFRDGPDLVLAVRVERHEARFRDFRTAHVHRDLAARVTEHQFASAVRRRQHEHQRAEHSARLFRVAMREEKAARVIHEQLVKFRRHRHALAAQPGHDLLENPVEIRRPRLAAEPHFLRRQLPHLAHRLVENRVLAPSVRRAHRVLDQRGDLHRRHGKRQDAHAFHLDFRHGNLHRAMHEKIPCPLHAAQQFLQRLEILIVCDLNGHVGHAACVGNDTAARNPIPVAFHGNRIKKRSHPEEPKTRA